MNLTTNGAFHVKYTQIFDTHLSDFSYLWYTCSF